jgi:hypothetical protein
MAIGFGTTAGDALTRTTTLPPITSFTMMAWVMIETDANRYTAFFSFGHATDSNFSYYLGTLADGTTLDLYQVSDHGGTALSVGTWYHLAMTIAGTGTNQALAYVNGVLDITTNGRSAIPGAAMIISNDQTYGSSILGRMTAVKIWNVALAAEEIQAEMRCYLPVRVADLNTWSTMLGAGDVANYAGTGDWTVGGTLTTVDGPPIPWSLRPSMRPWRTVVVATKAPPPRLRPWRRWAS